VAAGYAGHLYPSVVIQAFGQTATQLIFFPIRANQGVGDVLQETALQAASFYVAEEKTAVQPLCGQAFQNFAAHTVLDVKLHIGTALLDQAGQFGYLV
jgi:hypothetical protein